MGGRSPRGVIVDVGPVGTAGVMCGDTNRGVGGSGGVGVVLTTAHHCGDRWAALTLQAQSCCASHTCGDVQRAAHGCANGSVGVCKWERGGLQAGAHGHGNGSVWVCKWERAGAQRGVHGCANESTQACKGERVGVQMGAHGWVNGSTQACNCEHAGMYMGARGCARGSTRAREGEGVVVQMGVRECVNGSTRARGRIWVCKWEHVCKWGYMVMQRTVMGVQTGEQKHAKGSLWVCKWSVQGCKWQTGARGRAPGSSQACKRTAVSVQTASPLPRDQVDVMAQRREVLRDLLGGRGVSGAFGLRWIRGGAQQRAQRQRGQNAARGQRHLRRMASKGRGVEGGSERCPPPYRPPRPLGVTADPKLLCGSVLSPPTVGAL